MLSDTAEYALRAVLHIADNDEMVRVEPMAEALGVPRNYLSKTLHQLARAGILRSMRGPRGGFTLAVPADELTLYQVVECFDSIEARRTCLLGRKQCNDTNPCPAHHRWKGIADQIATFFRTTTVADLVRDSDVAAALAGAVGEDAEA
jgi:Rrf2 family protein